MLYTLVTRSPLLKRKLFRLSTARVKICQIPHVNLKGRVNSSSISLSFLIVMTHNFFVSFKLIYFLLWTKESHKSPNFETFKCCSENLPYSSCHSPNHKSAFLQFLHRSSVSWKVTPLYFFRSNIKYFT